MFPYLSIHSAFRRRGLETRKIGHPSSGVMENSKNWKTQKIGKLKKLDILVLELWKTQKIGKLKKLDILVAMLIPDNSHTTVFVEYPPHHMKVKLCVDKIM